MTELNRTPLHALHLELGAKMVPFAGYEMPVQYPMGVLKEHLHTRAHAGLFDVSHMGQIEVSGPDMDAAAAGLEALVPVDVAGLRQGRQRYAMFTDDSGGILDDLMIANRGGHFLLVVNAATKAADLDLLQRSLAPRGLKVRLRSDRALLALQGPGAEAALSRLASEAAAMRFMDVATLDWQGTDLWVSRSGYTGEDGYEISVPEGRAEAFARALLDMDEVAPIGLGARDSLRLEAGLCLYGSDIDATTTPAEAGLGWAIQKVRRRGGDRAGGFPGASRILAELVDGPARLRVGLRPEGRAPMRGGTLLFASEDAADPVGAVTSGGFGPSIEAPMAMGYVAAGHSTAGTRLFGEVRGKRLPVIIADMPFRPATYKR